MPWQTGLPQLARWEARPRLAARAQWAVRLRLAARWAMRLWQARQARQARATLSRGGSAGAPPLAKGPGQAGGKAPSECPRAAHWGRGYSGNALIVAASPRAARVSALAQVALAQVMSGRALGGAGCPLDVAGRAPGRAGCPLGVAPSPFGVAAPPLGMAGRALSGGRRTAGGHHQAPSEPSNGRTQSLKTPSDPHGARRIGARHRGVYAWPPTQHSCKPAPQVGARQGHFPCLPGAPPRCPRRSYPGV